MTKTSPGVIKIKEAAQILGISPEALRQFINKGEETPWGLLTKGVHYAVYGAGQRKEFLFNRVALEGLLNPKQEIDYQKLAAELLRQMKGEG